MRRRVHTLGVALLAGGGLLHSACANRKTTEEPALLGARIAAPAQNPAPSTTPDAEHERLLEIGRKLFIEKCGRCHNERGDKPLRSGPPLNERKLTEEVIAANVNPRLRSATPEQRRAVTLWIKSFLKN